MKVRKDLNIYIICLNSLKQKHLSFEFGQFEQFEHKQYPIVRSENLNSSDIKENQSWKYYALWIENKQLCVY